MLLKKIYHAIAPNFRYLKSYRSAVLNPNNAIGHGGGVSLDKHERDDGWY